MLPHRAKPLPHSANQLKNHSSKPFSVLSLGLLGTQKPKISQKIKENQKKVRVEQKSMKIHDENQNLTNFTPPDHLKNDLKLTQRNDNIQKTASLIAPFETTFSKTEDMSASIRFNHVFATDKIELQDITNQMISESEQNTLKYRNINQANLQEKCSDEPLKNQHSVINLSKKIKKVQKPSRIFSKHLQNNPFDISESKIQLECLSERELIAQNHENHLKNAFQDRQVIIDGSIYRNQIINQRIDNDIDSDDEQIASGIKRLHKALVDAAELYKLYSVSL